jgi:ketosteroid isomerase-like protein
MAFTGPADDRQKIRERLETYADAVMRQDLETYLACWTQDIARTGAGGECKGREKLRAHWGAVFGPIEQMAFFTQVASIAVDNSRRLVGEYADELVRVDDDWLFSHRHYRVAMTL